MTKPQSSDFFHKKLAQRVSMLLSPPIVAFVVVFAFAFFSPIGTGWLTPWQSFFVGLFFLAIGPILPLSMLVILGRLTIDVKNRRDRPLLYLAAIIVYSLGALTAWYFHNHAMTVLAVSYAAVTSTVAMVSLFWKISAHTAGVAGPLTGIIWAYGPLLAILLVFVILVAWARWCEKLHTIGQLAAGIIIAILVTAGVYLLLWGVPFWIL